jgi:hypothetical protein
MSIERAPATEMVATNCCVCGRPLLDAESVETGIGPVCAEKTGIGRAELAPEVRAEANRLVYRLAQLQRSPEAVPLCARLRALGLDTLADRIEERLIEHTTIRIERVGQSLLAIRLPKVDGAAFALLLNDLRRVPGRTFDAASKINTIPDTPLSRAALRRVLAKHFPGHIGRGPGGMFVIPTREASAA